MCENPYELLYFETFYLLAGDTVQIREKKNGLYRILYEYNAIKPEKIRIRVDREQNYERLDEEDGA